MFGKGGLGNLMKQAQQMQEKMQPPGLPASLCRLPAGS
ncbi:hypothetical protein ACUOAQ_05545, partial [Escherichia sp. SP-MK]